MKFTRVWLPYLCHSRWTLGIWERSLCSPEAAPVAISGRMGKEVVYVYSGILLGHKKE